MSYELKIKPKDRASGRFIGRVRKNLIDALIEEKKLSGINQQKLASALGVNRSVINRMLKGEANLTIRSIGEIAWAMGWEPELVLTRKNKVGESNHIAPSQRPQATSTTPSETIVFASRPPVQTTSSTILLERTA